MGMGIRGFLNDMRYINPRFTYLLTYLWGEYGDRNSVPTAALLSQAR